ncbi:MAG: UDP-2,3-diacylglucosamine diphosphatase [Pseudomonadales bacterium]|jgi:UDP-2,3-diacylglucosamine hydrolase
MRLFLSDLHLEDPDSAAFRAFAALLSREAPGADAIYLLGDLTEVWVGDDDDGPLARALGDVLTDTATRCRVLIMHGNRDFLFGPAFAAATGATLLPDPHVLDDHTLLAHGDAFCTDDTAYQQMRALFRSPDWQAGILGQSLADRRALAASLRAESRSANANKAENIMDVNADAVDREASATGARRIIHGHTHRPGRHRHAWGYRYVLGAWERCGWLARQDAPGSEPRLECFALAT